MQRTSWNCNNLIFGKILYPKNPGYSKRKIKSTPNFSTIKLISFLIFSLLPSLGLSSPSEKLTLLQLEDRLWKSDEQTLPKIEKQITQKMQINPSSAHAHYLMSHLYIRLFTKSPGNMRLLKNASELAEQAIQIEPKKIYGYFALADLLSFMGHPERSIELLNQVREPQIRKDWRYTFGLARANSDLGNLELALEYMNKTTDNSLYLNGVVADFSTLLIKATTSQKEMLTALKKWESKLNSPLIGQLIAEQLEQEKKYKSAHHQYSKVLKKFPNESKLAIKNAMLLHRKLNRSWQGYRILKNLLDKKPRNQNQKNLRHILNTHAGIILLGLNHNTRAEQHFLKAMNQSSQQELMSLIPLIIEEYTVQKNYTGLVKLIKTANQSLPGAPTLHALMGETLSEKLGRHDEALLAYRDAILLEPKKSKYYTAIGMVFYKQLKLKRALHFFTSARQVDPEDAIAFYNEACVYSLLKEGEKALTALRNAIRVNPNLAASASADEDFNFIKDLPDFHKITSTSPAGLADR